MRNANDLLKKMCGLAVSNRRGSLLMDMDKLDVRCTNPERCDNEQVVSIFILKKGDIATEVEKQSDEILKALGERTERP